MAIRPQKMELRTVLRVVWHTEHALKLVCNHLAEWRGNTTDGEDSSQCSEGGEGKRVVFGVMRVGLLAKRLLLHGDLSVRLVLLCTVKPTPALLQRIASELPARLAALSEETYEVRQHVEEAEVIITSNSDPKTRVSVTLTSPLMEDVTMVTEDLLNGPKYQQAAGLGTHQAV
uniref:DZF domain-containing protein n=1 Tax=Eptatretus burgeri TaxID=7764 RepID=A0A8C4N6H5_EPTBU